MKKLISFILLFTFIPVATSQDYLWALRPPAGTKKIGNKIVITNTPKKPIDKAEIIKKYWIPDIGNRIFGIKINTYAYINYQEDRVKTRQLIEELLSKLESDFSPTLSEEMDDKVEEFKPFLEIKRLLPGLRQECEKLWNEPQETDWELIFLITKHISNLAGLYVNYTQDLIFEIRKSSNYKNYNIIETRDSEIRNPIYAKEFFSQKHSKEKYILAEKSRQELKDYKIREYKLKQLLLKLKYQEKNLTGLIAGFNQLFTEIDFDSLKTELKSAKNTEQLIKSLLKLRSLLAKKGYYNTDQPHPFIKLLANSLNNKYGSEDIFKLIDQADISNKYKKKLNFILAACTSISQLNYILLNLMDIEVQTANAPEHALVLVPLGYGRFLFVDFAKEIVKEIDIMEYYQKKGEYLLLKKKHKINYQNLLKLKIQDAERTLEMNKLMEKGAEDKLLNLFYFYIQITNDYAHTPSIYNNLSAIYGVLNKYDEALLFSGKALKLNHNLAAAYNSRGYTYLILGEYYKAIQSFRKAFKINPDLATTYMGIGSICLEIGEDMKAIEFFSKSINLEPELFDDLPKKIKKIIPFMAAAQRLEEQENLVEQDNLEKKLTELSKRIFSAEKHLNLANKYLSLNKDSEAIQYYLEAIKLNPNLAKAYWQIGKIFYKSNIVKKAIYYYTKAAMIRFEYYKLLPKNFQIYVLFTAIYWKLAKKDALELENISKDISDFEKIKNRKRTIKIPRLFLQAI